MRFFSLPVLLLAMVPVSLSFLPSVDTLPAPGVRINRVMLFRATPFEVQPGDLIVLDGSGFSKTLNKVYFNNGYPIIATSTNGTVIKVSVPAGSAEGEYKLSVSNALGSSENSGVVVTIKVTSSPQPGPTIESASVVSGRVTLIGSGFTSANNLFTTLGNSTSPVSSSGDTLTFRLTDLSLYNQIKQAALGRQYQSTLWIFVQNQHGINKEPYKLDIVI